MAGAIFGQILNHRPTAKRCIFQYKTGGECESNLGCAAGCAAGCGLTGSCSEHGRIILGSWSEGSRIGRRIAHDISPVFKEFVKDFGR